MKAERAAPAKNGGGETNLTFLTARAGEPYLYAFNFYDGVFCSTMGKRA